jgi:hypothetical protein
VHRALSRNRPAPLLAIVAIVLAGCGATTEPGSDKFYREHSAEARSAAASIAAASAELAALSKTPSKTQLEALALGAHRARRDLLAVVGWTVIEDGEEEGVSQATREIHEGAGALLKAVSELRLYSQNRSPAALAAYRHELPGGREYWNQGITQLWYISKRADPPKI